MFAVFLGQVLWTREEVIHDGQAGVVRVLRVLGQQVLQVRINPQIDRLGGLHQAVNNRTGFSDLDGIHDMPVASTHSEAADRPLCGRVVNGNAAVLRECLQLFILVTAVFQSLSRLLT